MIKMYCQFSSQEAEENHRLWRREASKALAVLRTRLEELAIFLDDLLHQPALVVGLCADRQRVLREAINGSLELSRTIANLSSESLPDDCSHLQCTEGNGSLFSLSHGVIIFLFHCILALKEFSVCFAVMLISFIFRMLTQFVVI